MKEAQGVASFDIEPTTDDGSVGEPVPTTFNLAGGVYADPHPDAVDYLHSKNYRGEDELEKLEKKITEVVKKAFEWVGVIPAAPESTQPLEHSGLMPVKTKRGNNRYLREGQETTSFTELRDDQLVDEFIADDTGVNELVLRIKRAIQLRRFYSDQQLSSLYDSAKELTHRGHDIPPALRMVSVMVGGKPDNEAMPLITSASDDTRDIAPDVVIMLLLEDRNSAGKKV